MEYVFGALAGVIYGGLVGLFKYLFLWRRLLKENDEKITMKIVSIRLMISYITNFATLIVTYFIRNVIPFDFMAFAVATAIALSLSGKIVSIQKVLQKTEM